MTDNKLTDEEIISSLEVVATTGNCNECKIRNCKWGTCNCSQTTANAALDLINRQKAEIEALIAGQETLQRHFAKEKAEMESLKNTLNGKAFEFAENRAIKEFAERLKLFIIPQKADGYTREIILKRDIDNLVKEMVGEEK